MKVNNFYPNFLLKNGCAYWEGDSGDQYKIEFEDFGCNGFSMKYVITVERKSDVFYFSYLEIENRQNRMYSSKKRRSVLNQQELEKITQFDFEFQKLMNSNNIDKGGCSQIIEVKVTTIFDTLIKTVNPCKWNGHNDNLLNLFR